MRSAECERQNAEGFSPEEPIGGPSVTALALGKIVGEGKPGTHQGRRAGARFPGQQRL